MKNRLRRTGPQIPKHEREWYRLMMAAFNKALAIGPRYNIHTRQFRRFLKSKENL